MTTIKFKILFEFLPKGPNLAVEIHSFGHILLHVVWYAAICYCHCKFSASATWMKFIAWYFVLSHWQKYTAVCLFSTFKSGKLKRSNVQVQPGLNIDLHKHEELVQYNTCVFVWLSEPKTSKQTKNLHFLKFPSTGSTASSSSPGLVFRIIKSILSWGFKVTTFF